MKKLLIVLIVLGLASVSNAELILNWSFTGTAPIESQVADELIHANLDSGGIYNDLTRGAGAGTSAANSSFRTVGFQNDGIAIGNTDYFEFILSAAPTYLLSLTTVNATFAGTATYSASPGVDHQWGYRLGGAGDFTLIDTSVNRTGNGTSAFDLSGTSALQDVGAGTDVYLRYFATGQTSTGGWGFSSAGIDVDGTLSVIPEPGVLALLSIGGLAIVRFARRRKA
ncbi:MAG: PEP-CTERM sorting domain-containing protein [Verrucomicrobia bacterium]|nr:PEP-CTERM sorting domain-containing protein [Verrucomicrobiota bacterium]